MKEEEKMNSSYSWLDKVVKFDGRYGIAISKGFTIRDKEHAIELITCLDKLFIDVGSINTKGFINDPSVNIPIVRYFMEELKKDPDPKNPFSRLAKRKTFNASIMMNTILYNLIMVLMLNLIILLERYIQEYEGREKTEFSIDRKADLKTIRDNYTRMIHPAINKRLCNRGVNVLMNTFTGYDSEYDLSCSSTMTNELISIQLASQTSFYVKVPNIEWGSVQWIEFSYDEPNLNIFQIGEKTMVTSCCKSISDVIRGIREMLFIGNDKFIRRLHDALSERHKIQFRDIEEGNKDIIMEEKDFTIYTSPKTEVKKLIRYVSEYSSKELIIDSESINDMEHTKALSEFISLLNNIPSKNLLESNPSVVTEVTTEDKAFLEGETVLTGSYPDQLSDKMKNSINRAISQPTSRICYKFWDSTHQLNITVTRNLYLSMHESSADLSMLSDFNEFKDHLNLISGSFVTRGNALVFDFCKSKVNIRDTILLSPPGSKSLKAVGDIYGKGYEKKDIGNYRSGKMRDLLKENKELFDEYALQDAVITLKHTVSMEQFYHQTGKIGVPLTLSGISNSYVLKEWSQAKYGGYQVRHDINIGNLTSKLTPKFARAIDLSKYIVSFIACYRGGRNESFMYGIDEIVTPKSRQWFDYDLTSAYSTVMSILGHPDTEKPVRIYNKTVLEMSNESLLLNYISLDVDFKFPSSVKYPCIPTRVDDDVDIYPQEGRSVITGCEYLVAKEMGCRLFVNDGIMIPFKKSPISPAEAAKKEKKKAEEEAKNKKDKNEKVEGGTNYRAKIEEAVFSYLTPFRSIMSKIQAMRRENPKGTFLNAMYKLIANAIYGLVSMGISGKKSYDIATKSYIRVEGGILSNPILSSYICGFTRALIGECLNNIQQLGGNVVSTTTDGFITDIENLEEKIMNSSVCKKDCLMIFKTIRGFLTQGDKNVDDSALEIKKTETERLWSWKTRGQYGSNGISAATGFQLKFLNREFVMDELTRIMSSKDISNGFEYVQTGLRRGNDIYKKGGHVIVKYSDKKYNLDFDNKRCIIENKGVKKVNDIGFLDTKPWVRVSQYERLRVLNKIVKTPIYSGYSTQVSKVYKCYIETGVRGFIKACLSTDVSNRYGIPIDMFTTYQSIIDFVHTCEDTREVKLSIKGISKLKNRTSISRAVPRTKENELFIKFVKTHIPSFDVDSFFRDLSDDVQKARRKKAAELKKIRKEEEEREKII